jgi:hypothetical protein
MPDAEASRKRQIEIAPWSFGGASFHASFDTQRIRRVRPPIFFGVRSAFGISRRFEARSHPVPRVERTDTVCTTPQPAIIVFMDVLPMVALGIGRLNRSIRRRLLHW